MVNGKLPDGWTILELENCVDILDNQREPINATEREKRIAGKKESELYPYYGATGKVGWIDDYLLDEEVVLLGEDGAPFLDFGKDKAYLVRGKSWVNNHAHVLRAKKDIINNLFLMHYLNYFDYHGYVTGTTRLKLNKGQMRQFPIMVAPLPEQERIVAKIEELFTQLEAGTAALERVQAGLKRYKASVLKSACEGRLFDVGAGNVGAHGMRPASAQLQAQGRTPSARTDELPAGWKWVKLSEITSQVKDVDHKMPKPADTDIPYISTKDFIGDEDIDFDNAKHISEDDYNALSRKIKPEPNDILLSRYGTVGEVRKVKTNRKFQASYSIAIIKPISDLVLTDFLIVALRSEIGQEQMRKNIRASSQPDLGLEYIRKFEFPLPPLEEQRQIVAEVERRLSLAAGVESTLAASLSRAGRLRQSILKSAFEGRLVP